MAVAAGLAKVFTIRRRPQIMLRGHLHGNIRVQQLARECELSASHFARSFKVSFGVSPIQWVIGNASH